MRRRFCSKCGTPLFSHSSSRHDVMVVRVGALEDREIGGPASYIWTASKPSWGHIDPELPNCDVSQRRSRSNRRCFLHMQNEHSNLLPQHEEG
jgi:hypothetical protein